MWHKKRRRRTRKKLKKKKVKQKNAIYEQRELKHNILILLQFCEDVCVNVVCVLKLIMIISLRRLQNTSLINDTKNMNLCCTQCLLLWYARYVNISQWGVFILSPYVTSLRRSVRIIFIVELSKINFSSKGGVFNFILIYINLYLGI